MNALMTSYYQKFSELFNYTPEIVEPGSQSGAKPNPVDKPNQFIVSEEFKKTLQTFVSFVKGKPAAKVGKVIEYGSVKEYVENPSDKITPFNLTEYNKRAIEAFNASEKPRSIEKVMPPTSGSKPAPAVKVKAEKVMPPTLAVKPKDVKVAQPTSGSKPAPAEKPKAEAAGQDAFKFISKETIDLYKVVSNQKPKVKERTEDSLINEPNNNGFLGQETIALFRGARNYIKPLKP